MKVNRSLRLGLDLTGADRAAEELAPALLRVRELFPHLSLRVYWPIQSAIPAELMPMVSAVVHQETTLSTLSKFDRFLRRWRWSSDAIAREPFLGEEGDCTLQIVQQVITMESEPLSSLRRFPDSALPLMMKALKQGSCDIVISCGNTGAVVGAAQLFLSRRPGAKRLALAAQLPTAHRECDMVLIDCGATLEPTADQLMRFAEWGCTFAHQALQKNNIRIGLLNIGRESIKGTGVLREVYQRLRGGEGLTVERQLFLGNVEPADIWNGEVDLVLASGLMGNLYLKTLEALTAGRSERGGIAQLLGVEGNVFKLHGNATPDQFVLGVQEALKICHPTIQPSISFVT